MANTPAEEKGKFKRFAYDFLSKRGIAIFQNVFPEYFAKEPLRPTDRYIEYPFVIRNLPKPPAKVLDVGCSGSFFPLLLASFGYEIYGIDIRDYAIINKLKFKNFQFVKEDIRKTSFPSNFLDVITAISTMEHIGLSGRHGSDEDPDGDKKAFAEMKRILKPKGMILLTVPYGQAQIIRPYHRIYDRNQLNKFISDLVIEKEEYYMQNSKDDWYKCSKEEAGIVNAKKDRCSLCLLKIVKK